MWVLNREKDSRQSRIDEAGKLVSEWRMDRKTFEKIMSNVSSYPLVQADLYENLTNNKPPKDISSQNSW